MSSENARATGLAGRYATALYELAEADGVVDAVAQDLKDLQGLINESADLTRMIRSPVISREDQAASMNTILTQAGANDLVARFVGLAARNRRLFALPSMISAYLGIYSERRGEVSAEVTSAAPLTEEQMAALGASLKKTVGSDVTIDAKVDPGLLGGLVVKVGSRMFDSSLRTKLQHLRLAMKGVG